MSFLDTVIGVGKSLIGGGGGIAADLARTALAGYALKKVTDSINRDNARAQSAASSSSSGSSSGSDRATTPSAPDPGVRLQVDPDPSHKIPVVYGQAYVGGIITEARLSSSNQVLTLVFTICESTGTKLSDSAASVFSFEEVYINDQRVVFTESGTAVEYTVDRGGNVDRSLAGLCNIYCFRNGSLNGVRPTGYSGSALEPAYNRVPGWSSGYTMNNLVFAVVQLTYNADKNVTSIPNMLFKVKNTMTLPGDCLYDYMTNTRYGAGIPDSQIYSS